MPIANLRPLAAVVALMSFTGCAAMPMTLSPEMTIAGERLAETASDTSIHLALQRDMGREFPRYFAEMATEVHEGRVLIVGTIRTPEDRVRASQVAWNVRGVAEVVNELQVTEEQSFYAFLKDSRISNQMRARLLTAVDVKDSNYDFETVNSVVYILGVAQNKRELAHVAELAATIAGVERVVSHALLANDPRRQTLKQQASMRF